MDTGAVYHVSRSGSIFSLIIFPLNVIMAALLTVATMQKMMPVMLPEALPSHTESMTPRDSTTRERNSLREGTRPSTGTAMSAVITGMELSG